MDSKHVDALQQQILSYCHEILLKNPSCSLKLTTVYMQHLISSLKETHIYTTQSHENCDDKLEYPWYFKFIWSKWVQHGDNSLTVTFEQH